MAWFGTRTYVGASWTVMREADLSITLTEITATNPFPSTVALALLLRDAAGPSTHGSSPPSRSRQRRRRRFSFAT